jgi:hypothetical protein
VHNRRDIEIGDKVHIDADGPMLTFAVIDIADSVFGGRILHLEPGDDWIEADACMLIEDEDESEGISG